MLQNVFQVLHVFVGLYPHMSCVDAENLIKIMTTFCSPHKHFDFHPHSTHISQISHKKKASFIFSQKTSSLSENVAKVHSK
jgi:hypothetical protein